MRRFVTTISSVITATIIILSPTATRAAALGVLFGDASAILTGYGSGLGRIAGTRLTPTAGTVASSNYIQWQGLARRYLLIRPQTAQADAPAVIMLHPLGSTPEQMADITAAGRLAADDGVYVYLPAGSLRRWNTSPTAIAGLRFGVDDVGFISRLINHAIQADGIDASRVFVAGYSEGGQMTELLACDLAGKIRGIAVDAAVMSTKLTASCHPKAPVAAIYMNGTSDAFVSYRGRFNNLSAPASVRFWATVDGCSPSAHTSAQQKTVNDGTSVSATTYSGCKTTSPVIGYTINGGGHTWPGSPLGPYMIEYGRTTGNLNATTAIWNQLIAPTY